MGMPNWLVASKWDPIRGYTLKPSKGYITEQTPRKQFTNETNRVDEWGYGMGRVVLGYWRRLLQIVFEEKQNKKKKRK